MTQPEPIGCKHFYIDFGDDDREELRCKKCFAHFPKPIAPVDDLWKIAFDLAIDLEREGSVHGHYAWPEMILAALQRVQHGR